MKRSSSIVNLPMSFQNGLLCLALVLQLIAASDAHAQRAWLETQQAQYHARLAATESEQPHWTSPLITVAPRLEDGFRTDFVRQRTPIGQSTWSYGDAKGFQFVPTRHIELRLSPPSYFTHTDPRSEEGFGDIAFRLKYRIYGSSEQHHNAIVTVLLPATIPTGKSGNGSCCASIIPTLELGKGFGRLALTTSAGGSLPLSNVHKLGRQIAWNNAIQLRAAHFFWVETEFNSVFFSGGTNDGKNQTFVTPGAILSRIPLTHANPNGSVKLAVTLGAGEQIALTHFATYNHSLIFTGRLRF